MFPIIQEITNESRWNHLVYSGSAWLDGEAVMWLSLLLPPSSICINLAHFMKFLWLSFYGIWIGWIFWWVVSVVGLLEFNCDSSCIKSSMVTGFWITALPSVCMVDDEIIGCRSPKIGTRSDTKSEIIQGFIFLWIFHYLSMFIISAIYTGILAFLSYNYIFL